MNHRTKTLFLAVAALAIGNQAGAATLLHLNDNSGFDAPLSGWSTGNSASVSRVQDTNNLFGRGTSNHVLQLTDATSSAGYVYYTIDSPVNTSGGLGYTISYDMAIVSKNPTNTQFLVGLGQGVLNNANRQTNGGINNGSPMGNAVLGTVYTVSFFYNDSTAPLDYTDPRDGLTYTLAAGSGVSFIYDHSAGVFYGGSGKTSPETPVPIDRFGFVLGTSASNVGTALVDNLAVTTGFISFGSAQAGLTVKSNGFDENGDFALTVEGMDTALTYQLYRSLELSGDWEAIGEPFTPAEPVQILVDGEPPAGKAFYKVGEVTSP